MSVKTIVQLAVFEFPVRRVFEALTDSARHAAFTGDRADIHAEPGGGFSAYGGYITGSFIDIKSPSLVVQDWRASDWPDGVNSRVTIELQEKRGTTTLMLNQEGVPAEFAEAIAQGWHDYYWDRLREYLESGASS
ncbi:Activator of Hsp90 ATPase 1 family protein [Dehalogenimonas lykanthroporepellens BL-DC-9]|nr:Activator of Hsp90 ATPase 1 family protein [Dehalogenimonas lykanthroporepellens BL-DC-9]